jgi:hypothetical protein
MLKKTAARQSARDKQCKFAGFLNSNTHTGPAVYKLATPQQLKQHFNTGMQAGENHE